jgi:hypothetical protein
LSKNSISEKYLEALVNLDDWVTVSEWASQVEIMFPDLLQKANEEAKNQKRKTSGHKELTARIHSNMVRKAYEGKIEVDESERPKKVKFLAHPELIEEEENKSISRDEIKFRDKEEWTENDRYRFDELEKIKKQLSTYLGVSFELDHAEALLNKSKPGKHHPDNLQILIKGHNGKKSDSSWGRFNLNEQIDYLNTMITAYNIIASKNDLDVEQGIISSLIERLKIVY